MLGIIAIQCEHQRRTAAGEDDGLVDLAAAAQAARERAGDRMPGPEQRRDLLEAGALCCAAQARAEAQFKDVPKSVWSLLMETSEAMDAYDGLPDGTDLERFAPDAENRRLYRDLVMPGMSPEDVHDADAFLDMIRAGTISAWWLMRGEAVLGWCAMAPEHGGYASGAWHLYGSWVTPEHRRQGLARKLWLARMRMVPRGVPITVSIQAGKVGSQSIAQALGFRKSGIAGPWQTYICDWW